MLTDLPIETLSRILMELAHTDLLVLQRVAKVFRDFQTDVYFWSEKASYDLNIRKSQFYRINSTSSSTEPLVRPKGWAEMTHPDQRYVELVTRAGYVTVGSERYLELRRCFLRSIRRCYIRPLTDAHDRALIRYFQSQADSTDSTDSNSYLWVAVRNEAAMYRRLDLVETYIDKLSASEWNDNNLECLAMLGNEALIQSYLKNHPTSANSILAGAAIGGHLELLNQALYLGADNLMQALELSITYRQSTIAQTLLPIICERITHPEELLPLGHLLKITLKSGLWTVLYDLTHRFADHCAQLLDEPTPDIEWNDFLIYGVYHNYPDLINLALDHGARNWDAGLIEAAKVNNLPLAKYFIRHGATDYETAFIEACREGHLMMVQYLRSLNLDLDTDEGLLMAIRHDQWNLIEELLTNQSTDEAIQAAANTGHLDILDLVVEKLSPTPHQLQPALIKAINNRHGAIVTYLIQLGVDPVTTILNWIQGNQVARHLHDLPVAMIAMLVKSGKFKWNLDLLEQLNLAPPPYLQALIDENIVTIYQALQVLISQPLRNSDQDKMIQRLLQHPDVDPDTLLELARAYDDLEVMVWIHDLIISKIPVPVPQSQVESS